MWERITAFGTVILIILTLILISQGPALTWLHWPGFMLPLAVILGLVVAAVLNFRTARLNTRGSRKDTTAREPSSFDKLADEDSANMAKRLVLSGTSARLNVNTVEPYVDATFRIVNSSMFSLMSEKVEGNAFYRGYSGDCYLSRTPIIDDSLNIFTLGRGKPGELKLKLFVPSEITDNIASRKGKLKIDFGEVRVWFLFPGTGGHTRFCWFGDEVEVIFPNPEDVVASPASTPPPDLLKIQMRQLALNRLSDLLSKGDYLAAHTVKKDDGDTFVEHWNSDVRRWTDDVSAVITQNWTYDDNQFFLSTRGLNTQQFAIGLHPKTLEVLHTLNWRRKNLENLRRQLSIS